jgi:hypothetical protein
MESFLIENRMHHGSGRGQHWPSDRVEARTATIVASSSARLAAQRHKVIASQISQAACFAQQKREQDQSKQKTKPLSVARAARFGQNTARLRRSVPRSAEVIRKYGAPSGLLVFLAPLRQQTTFACRRKKPKCPQSSIVASLS